MSVLGLAQQQQNSNMNSSLHNGNLFSNASYVNTDFLSKKLSDYLQGRSNDIITINDILFAMKNNAGNPTISMYDGVSIGRGKTYDYKECFRYVIERLSDKTYQIDGVTEHYIEQYNVTVTEDDAEIDRTDNIQKYFVTSQERFDEVNMVFQDTIKYLKELDVIESSNYRL